MTWRSCSGGTKARGWWRWPGCPPRFFPEAGVGGRRLTEGGAGEGGLGGVGGVFLAPLPRVGAPPLPGREQRPDGDLGLGGNGVPERLRDRGRIAHAAWYTGWRSLKQYSTIERLPDAEVLAEDQ